MAIDALSSNEFLNFIIYDTISSTPSLENSTSSLFFDNNNTCLKPHAQGITYSASPHEVVSHQQEQALPNHKMEGLGVKGIVRKRRRRKPRVCKNKEEAETQRLTHITVERNRRKQMNEHLSVLRSLMPDSYVQRGDQASIVGGAIEFVKELEHLLLSLEAQKLQILQGLVGQNEENTNNIASKLLSPPPSQSLEHPIYTWSQMPCKFTSKTKASTADIEVTLIETHANMRILARRSPRHLSKLVAAFQTFQLSILHINVTTMDPFVLYSISAKLEEGCQFTTVDDIAGVVQHILRIIEGEASFC